jgi:hypothetical protein
MITGVTTAKPSFRKRPSQVSWRDDARRRLHTPSMLGPHHKLMPRSFAFRFRRDGANPPLELGLEQRELVGCELFLAADAYMWHLLL